MNVLSLFAGIGGIDLGLQRAGMTIVGQVEIDPWCRKVLEKHWPEWLMGYPTGWTDSADSATPSSPKSPNTSAGSSWPPHRTPGPPSPHEGQQPRPASDTATPEDHHR